LQNPKRSGRTEADINAIAHDLQELEILDEVRHIAKKHGVLLRAALGSSRSQAVVLARDAIIEFLRARFRYSSSEAGKLLRMDHTTVRESARRTRERKTSS
jgi:chromosomal replication initiation ATPase DnaA